MSTRAFVAGARAALRLVSSERVADRWFDPSALPGMLVAELAAHLGRAVVQVLVVRGPEGAGATPGAPVLDAAGYYAGLVGAADPSSPMNALVLHRARETAAGGHPNLVHELRHAVDRLAVELPGADPDERVVVGRAGGRVMLLSEYVRTRCVELAVHLEDLALSLGCEPGAPPSTVAVAVDVLQEAARRRHGDAAVLRALARRERDALDAARVL